MRIHRYLAVLTALSSASAASAFTVTLDPGVDSSSVISFAGDTASDTDTLFPSTLPFSDSHQAVDGGSSSVTTYDLSNAVFDITLDHARSSAEASFAQSRGSIFFSVDQNVAYTLSGIYTAMDSQGLKIFQQAVLRDVDADVNLFAGTQRSESTPNESFTLGLTEGDAGSFLQGSLTGMLTAGTVYELRYNYNLEGVPETPTTTATATGSLTLVLAPEPSTATLLAGGLLALAIRRSRALPRR